MRDHRPDRPRLRRFALALLLVSMFLAAAATGAPYHAPTVDGAITPDGTDWFLDDLVHDDFADFDSGLFSGNVRDLWLTWDEERVTVGLRYQAPGQTVIVYLDPGEGDGVSYADSLDVLPRRLVFPDGFTAGIVLAQSHASFGDTLTAMQAWRVLDAAGGIEEITEAVNSDDSTYNDTTKSSLRFPVWLSSETSIPWSEIYPDGVPDDATLKAVAVVTQTEGDGAEDVLPGEGRTSGAELPIAVESYHMSVVDQDGDGTVDPLDGVVSGTLALSDGSTDRPVTLTTKMLSRPGGDVDGFVYTRDFDVSAGDYAQGRLAEGEYRLVYTCPGYFPDSLEVDVAAGQILTGRDMTLLKATTITGVLDTELDAGDIGTYTGSFRLLDPSGAELEAENLINSDYPYAFTFFVSESGTYRLIADAEFHLETEFPIVVTAGEDVLDLALTVPRAPSVAGRVVFESGPGADGKIQVRNADGDSLMAPVEFTAADPTFHFYAPALGELNLETTAGTYLDAVFPLDVTGETDVTDLDLSLARQPEVRLTVAFADGPGNEGVFVLAGGDAADTTAVGAAGGAVPSVFLPLGDYEANLDFAGYDLWSQALSLDAGNAVHDLGTVDLAAVRADRLRLIDADGWAVESLSGTVSIPADDFYSTTPVHLEAVNADGRRDHFDLDAKLADLPLTARKLNDVGPPSGFARFLGSDDVEDVISTLSFGEGLADLWMANDAVEVLRVFVGPEVPDPLKDVEPPTSRFMIGFQPPEPRTVVLHVEADSLVADGADELAVQAQLYDSAGNLSRIPEQAVTFSLASESTGAGSFVQPTVFTNGEGTAYGYLRATAAGDLRVQTTVVVDGVTLDVRLETVDGEEGPLTLRALPGPTTAWELVPGAGTASLNASVPMTVRLVDALSNATAEAGRTVQLSVDPPEAGSFANATPTTDETGAATTDFLTGDFSGLITISAAGDDLEADALSLQVRDVTVENDPPYQLESDDANSFDAVDLTAVVLDNSPDELILDVPFASDWDGLQFHMIFETHNDAAGGTANPFEMPVNYGHADKPDFVVNLKFDQSYGDMRTWSDGTWANWWNTETEEWVSDYESGVEIQSRWASFTADGFRLRIPWTPFGGVPDSLRFQLYVTQDSDGAQRSAFDSVPADATLDLDFDYTDPQPGDWDSTTLPHTLSNWSAGYVPRTVFPAPPTVSDASASPDTLAADVPFTLTARVTDAGDGVGDVLADLSSLALAPLTRMYDDGDSAHGDLVAGDGVYSLAATLPLGAPGGDKTITVSAYDGDNVLAGVGEAAVFVEAEIDLIVQADDPVGDDHGPNIEGDENKYYIYPTNSVFTPGCFDLEGLDVYETVAVVNGQPVDMIAFRVKLGDVPDPADPETADWNPPYGELNITKVDILLDTGPGGATKSLPNRRLDVMPWNAWDYAIVMDGWYKALVPSLGQNTTESWRDNALKTDSDILLEGDFDNDTVTAMVSKEALGNPSADDILGWGMAVMVSSHDFGGEEVLGGIRWVNESRSEWNFGGGYHNDQDSNIIDLLTVPGAGRQPGRSQEEVLDYQSDRAVERLTAGETPCALEMSQEFDTGPPVITIERNAGEVVRRTPLEGEAVTFALTITDDTGVQDAVFRYRGASSGTEGWAFEDTMGRAGNDLWTVDISPAWMDTALVVSPLDGARYVEFQVEARDYGTENEDPKVTISPVTTLQLDTPTRTVWTDETVTGGDVALRHVDGSVLTLPDELRAGFLTAAAESHPSGADADSLAKILTLGWELSLPDAATAAAKTTPSGLSLGVNRIVALDLGDAEWSTMLEGRFDGTYELGLHYLQEALPSGKDEQKVALYEYIAGSGLWVLVGGNVNADANIVTANVNHTGTYGLFWSDDHGYDAGEVISGISVSPNPFSPNGDGLYDEATISFYLSQEATVTVEIYNIDGKLKRRLVETFPYSGADGSAPQRVAGLIWDGLDANGTSVPYGVYVLRLIVTYNQAGGQRTIRSNHPLAVIR